MKIPFFARECFLFLLLGSAVLWAAPEPYDRIEAVVDGEIILHSDLQDALYQMQNSPGFAGLSHEKLRKRVLDRMIDDKVILARARIDTIVMSDEDLQSRVDEFVDNLAARQGKDRKWLEEAIVKQTGSSLAEYRSKISAQIKEQAILQKIRYRYVGNPEPTPKEVQNFYSEYKDSLPGQRNALKVQHLQLKIRPSRHMFDSVRNVAASVILALDTGAVFEELAKLHSQDPAGAEGGDIGYFRKGSLEPEYERAAFSLALGKYTSRPVKTRLGFHIIKLLSQKDSEIRTAHILFRTIPTVKDTLHSRNLADSLRKLSTNFDAFSELARKYSDDKATREKGGNLGWFEKGELDSTYATVLDTMQEGEVSAPIFIDDSWHLFRLDQRVSARSLTLEDDWEKIESFARNIASTKKLQVFVKRWREEVYIDIRAK